MYDVVYACNDGYAKLCGISLISLLKNNSSHKIRAFIIDDKIGTENKERLDCIKDSFVNLCELIFVPADDNIVSNLKKYVSGYGNALDFGTGGGIQLILVCS